MRKMLVSKIHRATVTHADLHYEGSITVPPGLMEVASIHEYEAVQIWNVTSGTRFETYAISGKNSEDICINGAAAHLAKPGDIIIVACFCYTDLDSFREPKLVFVDGENQIKELRKENPGP